LVLIRALFDIVFFRVGGCLILAPLGHLTHPITSNIYEMKQSKLLQIQLSIPKSFSNQITNLAAHLLNSDLLLLMMIDVANHDVTLQFKTNPRSSLFLLYADVAHNFAFVCKDWATIIFGDVSNSFWERTIRFRWPHLKKLELKVKNWYNFTKNRVNYQKIFYITAIRI